MNMYSHLKENKFSETFKVAISVFSKTGHTDARVLQILVPVKSSCESVLHYATLVFLWQTAPVLFSSIFLCFN
jgi:hypothetical protein